MPLENASRSPRVCSWRGRKRSWARIEPSTGKPLNAVFAASARISAVMTMTKKNPGRKSGTPRPRAGRPSSAGRSRAGRRGTARAGSSAIFTPVSRASAMRPMNMVTESTPEQQQRRRRVLRLRLAERRHAVADRLDAGQRRAPWVNERRISRTSARPVNVSPSAEQVQVRAGRPHGVAEQQHPDETPDHHRPDRDHERVDGDGERGARLPDAAQVHRGQQRDRDHGEQHLVLGDQRDQRPDVRRGRRRSTPPP